MDQEKIGKFIAKLRKEKNMTQEELAEKMGVSINAVSKWERGLSFPDVSLYKKLCNELEINIEELINGEKDKSEAAKEKAIIKTITSKEKTRKQLLYVIIFSIIIIIGIIISVLFFYKSEEDKLQEYYDRNYKMSFVARDVDAILKYRNDGTYPEYYGGTYISDDAYNLIVQIVKNKIPEKGTIEFQYYNELITLNNSIKIEYVKNSYNDLEYVYNKLNEYFSTHKIPEDMNGFGIDIMNNCITIYYVNLDENIVTNFKENIYNSDLIRFESSLKHIEDYTNKSKNYYKNIGEKPYEIETKNALISIEISTDECIPVLLSLYDDNTYELFTAYEACKPGYSCNSMLKYTKSIKGKYKYDIKKIIDASTNAENYKWSEKKKPKYKIFLGEKYSKEYNSLEFVIMKKNKYLDELLKSNNIELSKCAKPEYLK